MKYPDESIQAYISPWWAKDENRELRRGRLIKAFVNHVDLTPVTLIPEGRSSPTDHIFVKYKLEPLQIHKRTTLPKLPTAAFPEFSGEIRTVYRAKKRPVLVISMGGPDVPDELRRGKPRWQTNPTILVAPYYGASEGGKRSGFSGEFIKRVKMAEYPNFLWDILPIATRSNREGSILRFDHIQPTGRHHDSYEWTEHCLSEKAMQIVDEWLHWLIEEEFPDSEDSELGYLREELLKLE